MKKPAPKPKRYMLLAMKDVDRLINKMQWEDTPYINYYKTKQQAYKYFGYYFNGCTWQLKNTARLYKYNEVIEEYELLEESTPIYFCKYIMDYHDPSATYENNPGYEYLKSKK